MAYAKAITALVLLVVHSYADAAAKAKTPKGPFNRDNAWKRYDHNLDPQSFPEYATHAPNCCAAECLDARLDVQGPVRTRRHGHDHTGRRLESIVGNEGVDADAMSTASTGFASFKETGARLPVLAEEGSKGTEASRSWTQELKMLGV